MGGKDTGRRQFGCPSKYLSPLSVSLRDESFVLEISVHFSLNCSNLLSPLPGALLPFNLSASFALLLLFHAVFPAASLATVYNSAHSVTFIFRPGVFSHWLWTVPVCGVEGEGVGCWWLEECPPVSRICSSLPAKHYPHYPLSLIEKWGSSPCSHRSPLN